MRRRFAGSAVAFRQVDQRQRTLIALSNSSKEA
jgi:hypothetical protein